MLRIGAMVAVALGLGVCGCSALFPFGPVPTDAGGDGDGDRDGSADGGGCAGCRVDGRCLDADERDQSGCSICLPARSRRELTPLCDRSWSEHSFADFVDGTSTDHGADLYVSFVGNDVRPIHTSDVDDDGRPDLVFSNFTDGVTTAISSYLFLNGEVGFDPDPSAELPTQGACGNAIADLNVDGRADVVFANYTLNGDFTLSSFIYPGRAEVDRPAAPPDLLATVGVDGVCVADLDRNGYLDLVFAGRRDAGARPDALSLVYWGQEAGFDTVATRLPTLDATACAIGDIDGSGVLDIVFSSMTTGATAIYLDVDHTDRDAPDDSLPTTGAADVTLADLNRDDLLDIVVAEYQISKDVFATTSTVFWNGGPVPFGETTPLAGGPAFSVSVAYLNQDTRLDIVLGVYETVDDRDSLYFLADETHEFPVARSIETTGASGNVVADFDDDGDQDIAFGMLDDDGDHSGYATIHWGNGLGEFDVDDNAQDLLSLGSHAGTNRDAGNVLDRRERYVYTSSVFDAGRSTIPGRISFSAETPDRTHVSLQLRSSSDAAELVDDVQVPFLGPDGTTGTEYTGEMPVSHAHDRHRYFQYRAYLTRDRPVQGPFLQNVTLEMSGEAL